MTELELPDGMGPAEALRGLADDLLAPDAKLRAFVDFGREERWDSGPLEGATHGAFLRLVADRIERETKRNPADDVSMSAYDLLPDEDRKAIAWVRDRGGLGAAKASFDQGVNEHGYLLEIAKMLGTSIYNGTSTADAFLDELRSRLMPAGTEWPRFEDDEPVTPGCEFADGAEGARTCTSVEILACEEGVRDALVHWDGDDPDNAMLVCMASGDRVKRPAPKVLDADGAEIRVGDTVWTTRDLDKFTVESPDNGGFLSVSCKSENDAWYYCHPTDLTHRAPVLAADGKPLREGETVWNLDNGLEYVVVEAKEDLLAVVRHVADEDADCEKCAAHYLTHEQPDSWERLEEDADALLRAESNGEGSYNAANDYCNARGLGTDGTVWVLVAQDLVRRAKKLAGVVE